MNKWHIGSWGKTDFYIHPAMLLYGIYAILTGHGLYMAISIFSILLHEGAHAVCSVLFGKTPGCIELTPLGAVMHQEDESSLPICKRILMLLAGPAATVALCSSAFFLTKNAVLPSHLGLMLFMCNLSILLLNMLPALPLDGGRITALLLGLILPVRTVHQIMRCISSMIGVGMIALNIITCWQLGGWNLSLAFAGCCLLYSSAMTLTTRALEELRWLVERKIMLERKGHLRTCGISALSYTPLRKLIRSLPSGKLAMFLCVEPGSLKLLGWLTEIEIIQQYLNTPDATVFEALSRRRERRNKAETDTN